MAEPRPARTRQWLSWPDITDLTAGGGGAEALQPLLAVERTWRLGLLRMVLDAVRAEPQVCGPLAPVEQAWELLARAEQLAPQPVSALLRHPPVGTWASYVLRRMAEAPTPDRPLWVSVGYLHCLAAAAGILAGTDFTITVPAQAGRVHLPGLGLVQLPAATTAEVAAARQARGLFTIDGHPVPVMAEGATPARDDGIGWHPVPTASAVAGGHVITLRLDSLDPFRGFRSPRAAAPLPPDRLAHWRETLAAAWPLVVAALPPLAAPLGLSLSTLVPLPRIERFRIASASAGDAFGELTVSEPAEAVELAVSLVHEFQHMKLGALLHLVPAQRGEPLERLYAPWRDDPRPLAGALQGAYAFTGVTEFWRAFRHQATGSAKALAQFEFARWQQAVDLMLDALRSRPELTEIGRELVAGLARTAATWRGETVPDHLHALATLAVADHRLRWRLHHLRPDPAAVARLAHAWLSRGDPDLGDARISTVDADPAARALDTLAIQLQWRLRDPAGFARLRDDPGAAGQVSGATEITLAIAAGERDRALALCQAALSREPHRLDAWVGLWHAGVPAGAFGDQPELVRAVHLAAGERAPAAGSPQELARWLGRRSTPPATRASGPGHSRLGW